jgi:hypothetical protein
MRVAPARPLGETRPAHLPGANVIVALATRLALAAALGGAPAPSRSPEVHALVARCVAAHGGAAALARAARMQQLGTVTSILHPGVKGRIGRAYERSGRLRIEVAFPDQPLESRVLDGGRGWRGGQEVGGPYLASMMLQAARLDLPALLQAWEARVEDRGTQVLDGRKLRVLALEVAPAMTVEAGLDPETGRIVRSRSVGTGGGPVEFITTYEDYRTVDGVLVAFREINWANGQTTGETVLEQAAFPASLPDDLFRP